NPSACSVSSLTYATPRPVFSSSAPASPGVTTKPSLIGTAAAGTTVSIYSDSTCTTLEGSGTAAVFGSTGIQVDVADGTSKTFYAKAVDGSSNTLGCSISSITYGTAPLPTFSSTLPASPGTSATPKVIGTAVAGTNVQLYKDSACTMPIGSPTAAATF